MWSIRRHRWLAANKLVMNRIASECECGLQVRNYLWDFLIGEWCWRMAMQWRWRHSMKQRCGYVDKHYNVLIDAEHQKCKIFGAHTIHVQSIGRGQQGEDALSGLAMRNHSSFERRTQRAWLEEWKRGRKAWTKCEARHFITPPFCVER